MGGAQWSGKPDLPRSVDGAQPPRFHTRLISQDPAAVARRPPSRVSRGLAGGLGTRRLAVPHKLPSIGWPHGPNRHVRRRSNCTSFVSILCPPGRNPTRIDPRAPVGERNPAGGAHARSRAILAHDFLGPDQRFPSVVADSLVASMPEGIPPQIHATIATGIPLPLSPAFRSGPCEGQCGLFSSRTESLRFLGLLSGEEPGIAVVLHVCQCHVGNVWHPIPSPFVRARLQSVKTCQADHRSPRPGRRSKFSTGTLFVGQSGTKSWRAILNGLPVPRPFFPPISPCQTSS